MANEQVAPVNHGLISGTATTTMQAAKGGAKGLLKGAGLVLAITAGSIFGLSLLCGAGLGLAVGIGLGGTLLATGLTFPFGGGLLGLGAGIGTLFGVAKGASRGMTQVNQERGQAALLDAQVQAYKAEAAAGQTTVYAPTANNMASFPMAQANPRIQADSAQYMGTQANRELALA